ncbi:MAG: hypothetical protein UY15_C0017G0021, partial [Parcubacteria group bacterium GW2011_GWA2_47_9]
RVSISLYAFLMGGGICMENDAKAKAGDILGALI